jgi:hypothetical protein
MTICFLFPSEQHSAVLRVRASSTCARHGTQPLEISEKTHQEVCQTLAGLPDG